MAKSIKEITQDFIQSLIQDWLKYLVVAVITVFVGWSRTMDWAISTPLLYALIAAASAIIIWNQFRISFLNNNLSIIICLC
jgi:hypothetical protein